jgi:hypothetical protein
MKQIRAKNRARSALLALYGRVTPLELVCTYVKALVLTSR